MPSEKIHQTYQRLLRNQSIGKALYWPVASSRIFPGCLGYFNDDGHWRRIEIDLKSEGSPFYGDLLTEDTGSYCCGVVRSSNIQSIEFDVGMSTEYAPVSKFCTDSLSGSLIGLPASTEFKIHVGSMSKGTALLQCSDPLIRKGIKGNVTELRNWAEANARYILEKERDAQEFGFVLVTSTFRTKKCSLHCWSNTECSVKAGSSIPLGSGKLGGIITTKRGQSGWINLPAKTDQVRWKTNRTDF